MESVDSASVAKENVTTAEMSNDSFMLRQEMHEAEEEDALAGIRVSDRMTASVSRLIA